MLKRGNCLPLSTVRSIGVPRPELSGPALAMKAPLLLFAVAIATAVAPPIRWFSLEQAIATQPRTARFSYKNCCKPVAMCAVRVLALQSVTARNDESCVPRHDPFTIL